MAYKEPNTIVICEECKKTFTIRKYTLKLKQEKKEIILCSSCVRIGNRNSNYNNIRSKRKTKLTLVCEECNQEFIMSQERIEIRYDKYKKHICLSCSKKGNRNPFYNMKFSKKKKEEFSQIRKEYYEDPEKREEQSKRFSGENNPMYKGAGLISTYTWRSKSYRESILKRDDYACQKCFLKYDKKQLRAHHLNSADWDIEGRMDQDNGICLCSKCHKKFHKQYGYGNNTKSQFEEFLKEGSETIESYTHLSSVENKV